MKIAFHLIALCFFILTNTITDLYIVIFSFKGLTKTHGEKCM